MATPLSNFFQTQPIDMGKAASEIATLNALRAHAAMVTEASEDNWQAMIRYNYHMSTLAARFSSYEADLKFQFTWMDPFRPQQKVVSGNIYFEWGCILWNMASFESSKAARIDRSTEEGIRTACKHFQNAAGIYDYIKQQILPQLKGRMTSVLSDDGINLAKNLMSAQAMTCFYEKSVMDKKTGSMKAVIVGKLAQQASVFFSHTLSSCKAGNMAPILDPSWAFHAQFQSQTFAGAAEYWTAMSAKEAALQKGTGYGEEVVRLSRAEGYFAQALAVSKTANMALHTYSPTETILRTASKSKAAAIKDLQAVYMEMVPPDNTISPVVGVSMVRPNMPFDNATINEQRLFHDFMPKRVIDLIKTYKEQLDNLVNAQNTEVMNNSNAGRASLSSIGLPGSLEGMFFIFYS